MSEVKMTAPGKREFWIKNKANEYTDDQFWATEKQEYDTDIHVIEYEAAEIMQNALIDSEAENVKLHDKNASLEKRCQELEAENARLIQEAEENSNPIASLNSLRSSNLTLQQKLAKAVEALEEIITHVVPHRDGLDGRFEETKSTVVACQALAQIGK